MWGLRLRGMAYSALEDALGLSLPGEHLVLRRLRHWLKSAQTRHALAEFAARLRRLGPSDICIDLGANVGEVTRQLAATGATVHAFEPDPLAWQVLQQSVGHLPNVVLHNAAVAADPGRYRLRWQKDFDDDPLLWTTSSYIVADGSAEFDEAGGIDIEVRSFAEVLRSIGGPVAIVKMDIEGSEFAILRQVLANPSGFPIAAIFCETHERDGHATVAEVASMRRTAAALRRPYVNLYWP